MRCWHITSIALERQFQPYSDQPRGVYDRRVNMVSMFTARVLSAVTALTAIIYFLSFSYSTTASLSSSLDPSLSQRETLANTIRLNGTFHQAPDGTKLIFQRPLDSDPKGTVLFFHGCRHSALDFFPKSDGCPDCVGLPEELHIVRLTIKHGFSVIAVSSTTENCWQTNDTAATGTDYTRVETALEISTNERVHISTTPLFAVGISSGGRFATSLTPRFPIAAVNSIISRSVILVRPNHNPPPHVFTHMHVRDDRTAGLIRSDMEEFKQRAIQAREFLVSPQAVTADFLKMAIPGLTEDVSKEIVAALTEKGFLNAEGHVAANPRTSDWRSALETLKERMSDSLVADASPLSEELNRAYAGHEITSDFFNDVLNFFVSNSASKVN